MGTGRLAGSAEKNILHIMEEPGVTAVGFSPSADCVRLEAADVAVAQFRPVRSLLSELLALQGEAHASGESPYVDGEDSGSECSEDTTEGGPDEDERPALVRASSSPIAIPCSE